MPREVLLINLIDEPAAIERYERWHAAGAVPPVVCADIRDAGILAMDIYRTGNRLVMLVETAADAAPRTGRDAAVAAAVQAWECQMDTVQRPLPWAEPQAKWTPAARIFSLAEQP